MRRENAADQYAAGGTIKINMLRDCFRHKGAQMAKVNPHQFQSLDLLEAGVGIEPAYTALQVSGWIL